MTIIAIISVLALVLVCLILAGLVLALAVKVNGVQPRPAAAGLRALTDLPNPRHGTDKHEQPDRPQE